MKKFFSIVIIFIMLFGLVGFAFAQRTGRDLEVEYPEIEGFKPEQATTPVTEYFKYIFNFLIWISGLIALVVLIYAGFQYFTSAGSPERINDAKSRIGAALLGLLILFGSYLILITINPDLIVFHLPRLKPIISELPAGVLLCKEEMLVMKAWDLTEDFKKTDSIKDEQKRIDEQRRIKKELDTIFEEITDQCYTVSSAEDIRGDFDNKVKFIYFIPHIWTDGDWEYETEYGVIVYEDRNFEGKSYPVVSHLKDPGGGWRPYEREVLVGIGFGLSSIKPFQLLYELDPNWKVTLYQKPNLNKGVALDSEPYWLNKPPCGDNKWWCEDKPLLWSPESIKIEGDLLAILLTSDGRSDTFFSGVDNNLLDNKNITNEEDCKKYITPSYGSGYWIYTKCAVAAATRLIIIGAKPY